MDIRFIIAMMIIAMIMDFLGRMARKRQAAMSADQDGTVDGADVLEAVAGADPDSAAGARDRVLPTERPGAMDRLPPSVRIATEGRIDPLAGAREVAETVAAPLMKPVLERAAPAPPVPEPPAPAPAREERVLELRDRAPREIEVRSREPRSLERRPARDEPPRTEVVPEPETRVSPAREPAWGPDRARSSGGGLGDRLGLGSAAALRRAVLVREVLGPPLALRDDGSPDAGGR